ncbi:beta-N-acetylhexosaminidase [Deinococcus sp.]|uniref:beta-N-acetylhexosaminidase n=1 Tax=Deinococcus sp. TaxID=47478 RepID=UPI003CC5B1EC
MTQTVKAGHLLMAELFGTRLDDQTRVYLTRYEVRAVCLFRRNIESEAQLTQLCAELREIMGPDALIAIDQEGGGVVRTDFWAFPPSALALGAADDLALSEQVAQANARFLRSAGINWNFAPVLDVNVNALNPVIGDRAFGSDPESVAQHGLAYARGLEVFGVAACAKHFPGHGDTHQDSHLELPTVNRSRPELEATELRPFERAVQAGVSAIMTAHIVFPALDAEHPATLSRKILTGLLRRQWGYDGVIITDSMGMLAIDTHYGRGAAAVQALHAGADMIMALGPTEAQIETLEAMQAAIDDGSFDPAPAQRRLSALARRFPAQIRPQPERGADTLLLQRAWARGLCRVGEGVRPALGSKALLVVRREEAERNVSEAGLSAHRLAAALGDLYDLTLHQYDDPAALDWPALREAADGAGAALLLATTGRLRSVFSFGSVRPDLHLCLWNPYAVLDVPAPALVTCGYRPEALAALRAYLSGQAEATGRMPLAGLT